MDQENKYAAQEAQALAQAMSRSADAAETLDTVMKKVQSTVKTTVKTVRSFLSDFDELQRLPDKEVTVTTTVKESNTQLAEGVTDGSLAYRIGRLQEALRNLEQQLNQTNDGVTQFGQCVLAAENTAVRPLEQSFLQLVRLSELYQQSLPGAGQSIRNLLPDLDRLRSVSQQTADTVQRLREQLTIGLFPGWQTQWGHAADAVKISVNRMIGYLNTLLSGVVAVYNTLGHLSWAISGNRLPGILVPKIPYLAQGAVLPANQPFLAVVGDQTHGTNIEAPLATIQAAVAEVTGEQTGAIMAGFEASVGVQKEILEAVLGIRIGDDTIAGAVRRYEQKMAVVRGG